MRRRLRWILVGNKFSLIWVVGSLRAAEGNMRDLQNIIRQELNDNKNKGI